MVINVSVKYRIKNILWIILFWCGFENANATQDSIGMERFVICEIEDSTFLKWLDDNVIATAVADSLPAKEWDIYVSCEFPRFNNITIALERTQHILWNKYNYLYITEINGYKVFINETFGYYVKLSIPFKWPSTKYFKWDSRQTRCKDPNFKEYDAYIWEILIKFSRKGHFFSFNRGYKFRGQSYMKQPVRGYSDDRYFSEKDPYF